MIAGKSALILGYGDVGKGCAQSLRGQGARVLVAEIDPICALQACMDGYQVVRLDDVVGEIDIFVTATGNKDIITAAHMGAMKHQAIVGNIGHFDNEIESPAREDGGIERINIKPQVASGAHRLPLDHRAPRAGAHLGNPPDTRVRDVQLVHQPGIAQIELFPRGRVRHEVRAAQALDEKVARLHLGSSARS